MIIKAKNEPNTSWQLEILLDPGSAIKVAILSVVSGLTRPLSSLGRALYTMVSVKIDTCWVRELEADRTSRMKTVWAAA